MKIKALSLKQPFANWVASGKKTIETRTWSTPYRGDILICASQSGKGEPRGVALCVIRLDNIRAMREGDAEAACVELYPKARAWVTSSLRILKQPIPIKGKLGLFEVEISEYTLIFK